MSGEVATTMTLRALHGAPLDDPSVRRTVIATASAIAERQGVKVLDVTTTASSITVTLATGRIAAWGFAAELRRLTTAWYTNKYNKAHLWGEVHHDDDDDQPWPTQ